MPGLQDIAMKDPVEKKLYRKGTRFAPTRKNYDLYLM